MTENNDTKAAYDEALLRLQKHMEEHKFSGSAETIKLLLTDQPVQPSKLFFSLDLQRRADVLKVIGAVPLYGWPDLEADNQESPSFS